MEESNQNKNQNQNTDFEFNPENVTEAKPRHRHKGHHSSHHSGGHHSHHGNSGSVGKAIDRYTPPEKRRLDRHGNKSRLSSAKTAIIVLCSVLVLALAVLGILTFGSKLFHTHSYGEWTLKIEPTCTEEGCEVAVCEACGAEKLRALAASHSFGEGSLDEATGIYTYTCQVRGVVKTTETE